MLVRDFLIVHVISPDWNRDVATNISPAVAALLVVDRWIRRQDGLVGRIPRMARVPRRHRAADDVLTLVDPDKGSEGVCGDRGGCESVRDALPLPHPS